MIKFIYKYWVYAGTFFSVLIICYVYFIEKNKLPLADKIIMLNLAFLMLHQFEENVYPGGFKEYFNNNLYNPFGFFRNKLTDKGIFWINVILGWGMNIIALIFLKDFPLAVLTAVTIIFINGLLHFFVTFKTRNYNPGVVTGSILFLPLGLYAFYKLLPIYNISYIQVLIIFITAGILSLLIPITIFATREKH